MKLNRIILGLALACASGASFAQSAGANAQTDVRTGSASQSSNEGNAQNINFNSPGDVKYSGSYTAHVAPSMVMGGFSSGFSNNNCANTTQGTVSAVVGGVGFGKAVESDSCNRRQNGMMLSQQAVTAFNMGYRDMAAQLLAAANYEFCMAGGDTYRGCEKLALVSRTDPHIDTRYADKPEGSAPNVVAPVASAPAKPTYTVRVVR